MMRVGLFKPVHVKTLVAQEQRMLLTSRKLLQRKLLGLELYLTAGHFNNLAKLLLLMSLLWFYFTLAEHLTADLVNRLGAERFLAIVGPSGSGKSSVVLAGLVPAIRAGAIPGSAGWRVAVTTPGGYPVEELEAALLRVAVNPLPSLIEQLRADELGLLRAVKRVLPDDGSELLLVIDQLEEVFTLVEDEAVRARFLTGIERAVRDPRSRLRARAWRPRHGRRRA